MVLMELVKARTNCALDPNLYFYRDSHQNEVDIVFKSGSLLIPVEVKSAQTFISSFLDGLNYLTKLFPDRVKTGCVIHNGLLEQKVGHFEVLNFRKVDKITMTPD